MFRCACGAGAKPKPNNPSKDESKRSRRQAVCQMTEEGSLRQRTRWMPRSFFLRDRKNAQVAAQQPHRRMTLQSFAKNTARGLYAQYAEGAALKFST